VAVALVASWAATISIAESVEANAIIDFEARPPLYYPLHGLALGSVMAAGVAALATGHFRFISIGVRLAYVVLFATAGIWTIVSYRAEQIFSREIFGATGPFVWLTLLFVLAGTSRQLWVTIDPVLRILAFATTLLAALNVLQSSGSAYVLGYTKHTVYCGLLMWLGGWTLLAAVRQTGWKLAVAAAPVVLLLITAIQSQARSWIVLSLLLGGTFVFLRRRDQGSLLTGVRDALVLGAVLLVLGTGAMLFLGDAVEGVADRLSEDTRTAQYLDFFSVVPASDLILGRGPAGTWYWYGVGDYQYFDNAFLWMLFIGGIPTLLCYLTIVIGPALRSLKIHPTGEDAAAMFLLLLWGLALTGLSTYTIPSVWFSSYLVSLCAGRCHVMLAERGHRRVPVRRAVGLRPLSRQWRPVGPAAEPTQ
jgi:hypothetical protein